MSVDKIGNLILIRSKIQNCRDYLERTDDGLLHIQEGYRDFAGTDRALAYAIDALTVARRELRSAFAEKYS